MLGNDEVLGRGESSATTRASGVPPVMSGFWRRHRPGLMGLRRLSVSRSVRDALPPSARWSALA
jgi:hypothetical protein